MIVHVVNVIDGNGKILIQKRKTSVNTNYEVRNNPLEFRGMKYIYIIKERTSVSVNFDPPVLRGMKYIYIIKRGMSVSKK